jgi:hypothetical protein
MESQNNVREGIVMALDTSCKLVIDSEVVRKSKPFIFLGNGEGPENLMEAAD